MAENLQITMFKYSSTEVPIFEGEHYDYWNTEMMDFFISEDLWDIIENDYPEPPTEDGADWSEVQQNKYKQDQKKDATALRYLKQGVSKSIYPRIFNKRKTKEALEVLPTEFHGNDKVVYIKLQSLWRDFDNLLMKESENIRNFFSRVAEIVNNIQDKRVVEKTLRSLPPKFDHCAFQSKVVFSNKKSNNFETSKNSWQNKNQSGKGKWERHDRGKDEQRSGERKNSHDGPYCIICKKDNHNSKDCRFKCTRCRIPNHSQRDCWHQKKQGKEHANISKEEKEDIIFYTCMSAETEDRNVWYIDSGCSNHMTSKLDSFVELDRNFSSEVKLGDDKIQKVEGKGTIEVHSKQGNKKHISDVLYVPNLAQNLLSVGQLIQKGYLIHFGDNACMIIDKKQNLTVAKIDMASNKVFCLIMPFDKSFALKHETYHDSYLWHLRYGHLS
ncbi:uncharacterized protein [Primulina huaijiensis]|uniref:uncharacterized protein n=1 Tax=Primulina huaijiensis TaxID=1492673 RepID=UPI003CC78BB6